MDDIRNKFKNDLFAMEQGITIDEVTDERTVCSVTVKPCHRNAMGSVQGGFIFTLADFAFAVATNHKGMDTVTLDSNIHFLKAPKGNVLTAVAAPVHDGRSTCLYTITVLDELGTLVAQASSTGYRIK